jgi:UDP-N-acetylmuramate dehydrogenase
MIKYIKKIGIPYYIMGNGSNILISDEGIRGVVVNLESGFGYMKHEGEKIIVGAGVKLARFVDFCIQKGYEGVEMLAGIPATIGGALVMNAGCYGGEISTYVTQVQVIKNDEVKNLTKDECGFVYRNSNLKNTIILESTFILPQGNPNELNKLRKKWILQRNDTQPVEIPNAGCVFKNPPGNFAAKLIEECGLKGTFCGGAMVSAKHSNFIVNYDNATAKDVVDLIKLVRNTVKEMTGIQLELEIKPLGFEEGTF